MAFEPREDVDAAKAAVCEEPGELFAAGAREVLSRAGATYLAAHKLTAIELLYSPRHQETFLNAGTSAMQAVQKTAGWQVRGTGVPVSERIRRLWEIVDAARKDQLERVEMVAPEPLKTDTAPRLLSQGLDEDDEAFEFRTLCSIAAGLAEKRGWAEKVTAVLAFAEGATGPLPLSCIDQVLAELMRAPEALTDTLGDFAPAGDAVSTLYALLAETAGPEDAPPRAPLGPAFYAMMTRAPMTATRATLAAHLVRIVTGPEKMTTGTLAEEIAAVANLRETLTLDGDLIGGDATQAALERRLSRALSDQTIDMLMQGTKSAGERVMRALSLHRKVFGEVAHEYLNKYVADLMGQPAIEDKLLPEGLSVRQQIKSLGALHRALMTSGLGERNRERMARQVEQAQTALLDRTRLLEKLNDGSGSAADRLMRVIDLCRQEAFIEGENATRARSAAQQLMKRPDFLESYLSGADQKGERAARLRDLQKMLAEARIV